MSSGRKRVVIGVAVVAAVVLVWLATRSSGGAKGRSSGDAGAASLAEEAAVQFVCVGRVEPVGGEVDVCAQVAGTLETVTVNEGERVEGGALLAKVDARRENAQLALAVTVHRQLAIV